MPRVGAWTADLFVDTDKTLTGSVSIKVQDGTEFKGTVDPTRTGNVNSGAYLRVIGGAGGLSKTAKAKFYNNPTIRTVLSSLLSDAGETLSNSSSSATLGTSIKAWTVLGAPTGAGVKALLEGAAPAGTVWRTLRDGSIFVGTDSFTEASGVGEVLVTSDIPAEGRAELAIDLPLLVPGQAIKGKKISYIEHVITPEKTRSFVWYES